ncbi:hypothetical protein HDU91_007142 [Kappamyces sp. JEL0680]|nr:hypothetical protein HDU91_007142 [Kappamyces sp. JEL0680]
MQRALVSLQTAPFAVAHKISFHSSSLSSSRYPALATKISRYAHQKNLRKIKQLKKRLGDDYKPLAREKRQSPYSERNSPSKATQPPAPPELLKPIHRYYVGRFNHTPKHFVPGRALSIPLASSTGPAVKEKKQYQSKGETSASISMPTHLNFKKAKAESTAETLLTLPKKVVPPGSVAPGGIWKATAAGPFYQYGLTRPELSFLFNHLPAASKDGFSKSKQAAEVESEQQSELVRRILSISTGNTKTMRKFNVARSVEMFQRHTLDTGSAQVQAAVMDVKITAMRKHLSYNKNDKSTKRKLEAWVSKQRKMLKYLRRKVCGVCSSQDLSKCIQTCISLGIDPQTVTA